MDTDPYFSFKTPATLFVSSVEMVSIIRAMDTLRLAINKLPRDLDTYTREMDIYTRDLDIYTRDLDIYTLEMNTNMREMDSSSDAILSRECSLKLFQINPYEKKISRRFPEI